jgi:hypothetical protein
MTEQQIIKDVCDWYDNTFPDVHPMHQVHKLVEEWGEYKQACVNYRYCSTAFGADLERMKEHKEEEAADVAIVIITILRNLTMFNSHCTDNFLQLIFHELEANGHNLLESIPKKMVINKQRALDGRWK